MTSEELIVQCCENNDLDNIVQLHNTININKIDIKNKEIFDKNYNEEFVVFVWLCINSKLEIVKYLHSILDYTEDKNIINYKDAFFDSCQRGKLDVAKWLHENKKYIELNYNVTFGICAYVGNLEMCKWLYSVYQDMEIDNIAFNNACDENHLELMKWMYFLPNHNIKIHEGNECPFVCACYSGRLDICQWLYSLDPNNQIDIHVNNDMPIYNAKLSGNQELIDWIQTII